MTRTRSLRPASKSWQSFWLRRSRLEKVAALVLLMSLIVDNSAAERFTSLGTLLHLAAAGCFLALLFRYLRGLLSFAIWRLRNRLLITYLFIAVVPIVLVASMGAISSYIFYGMVSTYMAHAEVQRLQDSLALAGRTVALDLEQGATGDLNAVLRSHLGPATVDVQPEASLLARDEVAGWMREKIKKSGSKRESDAQYTRTIHTSDGFELRSVAPTGDRYLMITAPLERSLRALTNDIGVVTLATQAGREIPAADTHQVRVGNKSYSALTSSGPDLQPRAHPLDIEVTWPFTVEVFNWETGEAEEGLLIVHSRPSLMNKRLFSNLGSNLDRLPWTILAVAGGLFLLIELGSLVVGVRLTASITGVVNDLHEGTERVNRGDFSYRIPVRGRDQLSGLAESFNAMTVSLERLIQESTEKERLQSELEIASQVQRQLFPKQLPNMRGLEVAGICRPARVVSGDYYDFMAFDDNRLALAIGDIAGKGISAALVMAGIQAALHAQLHQGRGMAAGSVSARFEGRLDGIQASPQQLVSQLNRQLYESTAASTFATFCYATYDDSDGRLTYTNAGHLPPLVVGPKGYVRRLTTGGLVLGIMPEAPYQQESVNLRPGELLVLYTDGITEPENSYGGEFGEDRLLAVVQSVQNRSPREVAQAILQAVEDWSDSTDSPDDMTLLVARRL